MLRKVLIMAVLLVIAFTTLSYAQLPKGKWWKLKKIATSIGLTDEQIKKIENLFMERKKKLIEQRATYDKEEVDLEAMFDNDEIKDAELNAQIDKLETARSQLHKTHLIFLANVRKVLTKEQYEKLKAQKELLKRKEAKENLKEQGKSMQKDDKGGAGDNEGRRPERKGKKSRSRGEGDSLEEQDDLPGLDE